MESKNSQNKLFSHHISDKILIFQYIKNSYNITKKKQIIQLKIDQGFEQPFLQESNSNDQQIHKKKLIIGHSEVPIKITMRCPSTPTRIAIIRVQ